LFKDNFIDIDNEAPSQQAAGYSNKIKELIEKFYRREISGSELGRLLENDLPPKQLKPETELAGYI